jgi:hypothetical protein
MWNTSELFTTTLRCLTQTRHFATVLSVLVLVMFGLTLPSKADVIDTNTISPNATFDFQGTLETATGSITVDTFTFQILSGSATLTGPSPEAATYSFEGVNGSPFGFAPNLVLILSTGSMTGQSPVAINSLFFPKRS